MELRPKKLDEFDKETAIDTAASMKIWRHVIKFSKFIGLGRA